VIGHAVLRALQVSEAVVSAVESEWNGYLAFPPASLGDTLLLADQLAPLRSPLEQVQDQTSTGVAPNVDLILEKETLEETLDDSAGEMPSLTQALQA
jgi:hypothetical protein